MRSILIVTVILLTVGLLGGCAIPHGTYGVTTYTHVPHPYYRGSYVGPYGQGYYPSFYGGGHRGFYGGGGYVTPRRGDFMCPKDYYTGGRRC